MTRRTPPREILKPWQRALSRVLAGGFVLLAGTGVFLLASGGASDAAAWVLLAHIVVGALLLVPLFVFTVPHAVEHGRRRPVIGLTGALVLLAALAAAASGGLLLLQRSSLRPEWTWWAHVGGGFGLFFLYGVHRRFGTNPAPWRVLARAPAVVAALAAACVLWEALAPVPQRATAAPTGSQPFAPSLTNTDSGLLLESSAVIDDLHGCVRCHERIAEDWRRSAHRHASFTNPFYKGTIRAMREKYDLVDTRWCAACHDPALLFTGKMESPDLDMDHDPDTLVGLSCVSCHAVDPQSTLGNGHYLLGERTAYAFESSDDPALLEAHDILLRAKPDAHIESLRPHNIDQGEFCSLCHKAEVPPELNRWKWFRAQNEFDAWHDSGVSLNNVRSFYHPEAARRCQDCHMPLVPAPEDPASDADGLVRSHLFAGANTALPFLRGDEDMIERGTLMLQTACRVDVTAVVLEPEAGGEDRRVYVPAWRAQPAVRPGQLVEADVVVRNQGVGHRFPGGTIDSNEVWVLFEASAGEDEPFYVSGAVDPETGLVDPSAEFYRAYVMNRDGERVVNRIGPDVYTRVYAKTIAPGTADVVRYRFRVPDGATGTLRLRATLRYRKFMREYLDFLFPDGLVIEHRLDDGSVRTVDLEELPVIDMAVGELDLPVTAEGTVGPAPDIAEMSRPEDLLRVNDLAIGHFLQGDPDGAEVLWQAVTRIDPTYGDGWVNLARARIQGADWPGAEHALERALEVRPGWAKPRFFQGEIHRRLARWPEAEAAYREVLVSWPLDREALRQLTVTLYEQDRFEEALATAERMLAIDPEDARTWFWVHRIQAQLGNVEEAEAANAAFDRFRPDEDESTRAGAYRLADPRLQRMAQPIHVHEADDFTR